MFQSIVEAVFYYAEKQPDKLCLADDNNSVTYKKYAEMVQQYSAFFSNIGLNKGDNVVVEACQTIEYLSIELALQLIGAVFVPVEHNCATEKINSFITLAKAKAAITVKPINVNNDIKSYTYDEFLKKVLSATPYQNFKFPDKNDISEILFSTGTTGKEKGIVLTHKNNIALAENVMYGVKMEKDNVEMIPSPMNHSHGLRRYYANMYNGSSVVLLGSVMDIMRFFRNIDTYNVNSMDLVPAALSVVLKLSKNKLADYKDKLRYIQFGAAPLIEKDKEKICQLLPYTMMFNFYGSTESGCTCIYNFNQENPKNNCIGKPTHNTELYVVDDNNQPVCSDKDNTGCLATKGDMNMSEYWKDKDETLKVLRDGIVYSNDICYVDSDGDVILLGRKGDVINVGGNKVSPEEIENVTKQISYVVDCGCIPVEDEAKGNVPKLFVQLKKGQDFNPIEIRTFIAKNLEPYKVPQFIVQIDKIPRSYNGKLLRKELKQL